MKTTRWQRIEELFQAALDVEESARPAFLDSACQDDDDLRDEIESLLNEHSDSESFLETPVVVAGMSNLRQQQPRLESEFPDIIGSYRIIRLLGRGGMGVVYLAEQERPRRTVALKLIKSGMATPRVLRRFEQEAEVLARLQHPGIAGIYEAGTLPGSDPPSPFLAMEYIEGRPLNEFAKDNRSDHRLLLRMLAGICDAVHHAHQKGVIHRDLKPGNILVADDRGSHTDGTRTVSPAKVLDFGVARLIEVHDGNLTLATNADQLVGTMPYMSPEQVSGNSVDLDTRSDVYALGVIGYEMLSGSLPYPVRGCSIPEAARLITECDPEPLGNLNNRFRGDIETIIAKALEKNRDRRYGSAAELAEDIRRFLEHEPIAARPQTTMYQLSKFARRNPPFAVSLVGIFALLVIGVLVTSLLLIKSQRAERLAKDRESEALVERQAAVQAGFRADQEKNRAEKKRKEAEDARAVAHAAKARAEAEGAKFLAVNEFLNEELLRAVDPVDGVTRDPTVSDVLENAATSIDRQFGEQPLVEAAIRQTIGTIYMRMDRTDDADPHLRKTLDIRRKLLGEDDRDTLAALANVGGVHFARGEYDQAREYWEHTFARRLALLGPDDFDTLSSMSNLGLLYKKSGELAEARRMYEQALTSERQLLGDNHLNTLNTMHNLAALDSGMNYRAAAERRWHAQLKILLSTQNLNHPYTLRTINSLGNLCKELRRYDEAEYLIRSAHQGLLNTVGGSHSLTLSALNNLGILYDELQRHEEAAACLHESLKGCLHTLGRNHPETLNVMNNLAACYLSMKRMADAEAIWQGILPISQATLGDENPRTLIIVCQLAQIYTFQGRFKEAEPLAVDGAEGLAKALGEKHGYTRTARRILIDLYRRSGEVEKLEALKSKWQPDRGSNN